MDGKHEHWATGDAYEQFMGRWSWEVALKFLKWLEVAPQKSWLDVGCGTGALTRAIATHTQAQSVYGLDASLDFVQYASTHLRQARFLVADGAHFALQDGTFDAIVSGLALNFIPHPEHALSEMRRVAKPDGLVAAYVWDYADKMEFLRYFWDSAVALDESANLLHEGNRFPVCQPDALHQLWAGVNLHTVQIDPLDIPTVFDNFDEYWHSFTVGNFPAPNYVASLDETRRNSLRDHLHASVPIAEDGTIRMIARVWAIRGYR